MTTVSVAGSFVAGGAPAGGAVISPPQAAVLITLDPLATVAAPAAGPGRPARPPPVVLAVIQGRSRDFPRKTPNADGTYGGVYAGVEPITYTIWAGDEGPPLLSYTGLPNGWIDATQTCWLVSFDDAHTAALDPGRYRLEVAAVTVPGRTGSLFEGLLEVTSAAGEVVSSDLASGWYVLDKLAVGGQPLNPQQLAALPYLITASSELIERYCARRFRRRVVAEDLEVGTYGQIRLSRPPVHRILRIQADPVIVLQVSNRSAVAAWIHADTTGATAATPAPTGVVLNWQSGGQTVSQPIAFAALADQRIASLAQAIGAAGGGWAAQAEWSYADLPISELASLDSGVGASPGDRPDGYAPFWAYSRTLTGYQPATDRGERTGIYSVGRMQGDSPAQRWGPGGEMLWGDDPGRIGSTGRVRVTYDGGFRPIPDAIQLACAELVRLALLRLSTDVLLKMEQAGEYRYELDLRLVNQLPGTVLWGLNQYRIINA